jgi:hypothetical protein
MPRIVALALGLMVAAPLAAQSVVAGPVTPQVTAALGERVTVGIAVSMVNAPGLNLGSYRARFRWNPALSRLVSVSPGTFAGPAVNADSAALGIVWFAAADGAGAGGVPILANITLEVLSLASADTFRVAFHEMNAAVTFQDLLPILTVTTGTFCAGALYGDLNNDGLIQALDAQIALMHAVGMAVTDTTNGDVDGDGVVGTRDALVILSDVVGLDVSAFRVGTFVSNVCAGGSPASVTVVPAALTLAAGDSFRVSAQVRDSVGNLQGALQLGWASSDATLATVDSTGVVRAVANGTVTLTASVSPTLSGGAGVTVAPRRRWRVDPANAKGPLTEVGSDAYPFSTLGAALARAAPNDTVSVGVARYAEPLVVAKPLTILGDSGAAGMPVLQTPSQPVGALTGGGRMIVRRLRLEESQAGLYIQADTIVLSAVWVTAVRGRGLRLLGGMGGVEARDVRVDGARNVGIGIEGARTARLARVRVTGIDPDTVAHGVAIRGADTVTLDTVTTTGTPGRGISVVDADRVLMRGGGMDAAQVGLYVDSSTTLDVSHDTRLRTIAGSGILAWVDTLRVSDASLAQVGFTAIALGRAAYHDYQLTRVRVDTAQFGAGGATAFGGLATHGRRFVMRNSLFVGVPSYTVWPGADTVVVDSTTIGQSGFACGLVLDHGTVRATVTASRFAHDGFGIGVCSPDPYTTGAGSWHAVGFVSITGSTFDRPYTAIHVHPDSLTMVDDTMRATGWGIWQQQESAGTIAQRVQVRGGRVTGTLYQAIAIGGALDAEVVGVTVDSAARDCGGICDWPAAAVEVLGAGTVRLDSNMLRHNLAAPVIAVATNAVRMTGDSVIENDPGVVVDGQVFEQAAVQLRAPIMAVHSLVALDSAARAPGLQVFFNGPNDSVVVEESTFHGQPTGFVAVGSDSLSNQVRLARNQFSNHTTAAAISSVRAVRLDTNTVTTVAVGLSVGTHDTIVIRGNTVNTAGTAGIQTTRGRASLVGIHDNVVTCASTNSAFGVNWQNGGSGTYMGNEVRRCQFGMFFPQATADSAVVVFRDNVMTRDGAATAQVVGVQFQGGAWQAEVAGNTLMDGNYTFGGIVFTSSVVGRVDSNVISGAGVGRLIRVTAVDSLWLRDNVLSGVTDATVLSGAGGVVVGPVARMARVVGNRLQDLPVPGVRVLEGTPAGRIRLDSNLAVDGSEAGFLLRSPVTGIHNGLRRNVVAGILDSVGGSSLTLGDIEGNAYGYLNATLVLSTATDTWWGAADGPTCNFDCSSGTGDEVSENVTYEPFATEPNTGVPAGAPPALAVAREGRVVTRPTSVAGGDLMPLLTMDAVPALVFRGRLVSPRPAHAGAGGSPTTGATRMALP